MAGGTSLRISPGTVAAGAAVAVAYAAAAELGFKVAFIAEQVTTVWPPTGIALAALLLGGLRFWPAIWIGAFVANAGTGAPLWTAVVLATGNTLEGVLATWLLRRLPSFDDGLRRVSDVLALVIAGACLCTMVSASIGVTTLCVAGVQPWARFGVLWFDWWLGDALGALIAAPAILTAVRHVWTRRDWLHSALFVTGAAAVSHFVFGQVIGPSPHPLEYVVFPLAIAAAVRGGPHVTSLVVLAVSVVTIWHTVQGTGPFASREIHEALVLLQVFMGVLGGTALLVAAAVLERKTSERGEQAAAAVLREREEMLLLAQRAGGVAIFDWDVRRETAHCSAEYFRIFGLPAREGTMTADAWWRFLHPDDRDRMTAHLARAIEGREPAVADYRITAADGALRWLSYAGQIQGPPERRRIVGTVLDITDRKRLEDDLRQHATELSESRDVLALAMRGGSMGAWARNMVTEEVWWSPELEEIVGLEPGGFDRTLKAFFDLVHPDDRPDTRTVIDDAVERRTDYTIEFRFRHASGEWRWMEGRGRAVYNEDGSPRTLYGIGIDITSRKRAEMALREAMRAAESANQLKDQFLATLSHELRTPLNAILGYARMLQANTIPPDKRPKAIDVIERNAVAQNQLIDDLLDMSRITAGKVRLDPAPIPVATVLREAVDGVKPTADGKGIALDVEIEPFAGTVTADTARLQQVFANLLTNAVKFTPRAGQVSVSLRRDGASVEIRVADTGVGISPEFLPFIFEPFRQADGRFDRGHGGLGLGLAITRQLVDLHGGTIHAASDGAGRGAAFTIRLPQAYEALAITSDAAATEPGARPEAGPASLDGLDILLVDDEPDTLTMFRDALENAGAHVRAVDNAAEAIRVSETWHPHLLITDLGLPGMDGYELLQTLRGRASQQSLPAVAVSAYASTEDRARALAVGFKAHFAKPIDPAALVRALASAFLPATGPRPPG
ncbi:MAG TPA: MASE1 domain-containing protein [Vicinamibacterales bacterium]|nr:MASE1 domain-containing protein [Vicinamibacterales bacterium]